MNDQDECTHILRFLILHPPAYDTELILCDLCGWYWFTNL